jgi:hypothetical protein
VKAFLNQWIDYIKTETSLKSGGGVQFQQNEKGSIIIIALMILVTMTAIAVMSSRTVVTENFIIRNQAIQRQNISMVEAALIEYLQRFMHLENDDPDLVNVNTSSLTWINSKNDTWADIDWFTPGSSDRILDTSNSVGIVPQLLTDRGESHDDTLGTANLRVAFAGWQPVTGGSLGTGSSQDPVWREGRLMSEYVSLNASGDYHSYGMLRMEIGVRRRLVVN